MSNSSSHPRRPFAARIRFFLPLLGLAAACGSDPGTQPTDPQPAGTPPTTAAPATPITQFVRRIHEDARGHLWLGTNGDGVAR